MKIFIMMISLVVLVAFTAQVSAQTKSTADEVTHQLTCQCGTCPNLALYSCTCGTADNMRQEVKDLLDSGMDSDQVVESFIEKYGDRVLAAPRAEGFYLTAWVMPIFAVLAFGLFILFAISRWSKKFSAIPVSNTPNTKATNTDHYSRKLDDELNNF